MPTGAAPLLQADGADTTLLVVLLLIALGIGYIVMRAAADKITGVYDEEARYEIMRRPGGELTLAQPGDASQGAPVAFSEDQMRALVEAIHARNEMRLHGVVLPGGERVAFQDLDPDEHPAPTAVVLEDSRGRLEVERYGLVETNPPLDDAVRRDLLEVLDEVLADEG